MSDDYHYAVLPDAAEKVKRRSLTPLRRFKVAWVIEGDIEVEATDAAAAKYLVDNLPRRTFEDENNGTLFVFPADPVEPTQ